MYDWNSRAEGALPDVDWPGPVVATARAEMQDMMYFQAALPMGGGAMPTSEGNTGGGSSADSVANSVAGGGMPTAYKRGPAG